MKIKCIVVLGLTTFGLMAFAGCGGDDSADTTAKTPPPEPTAAPELSAEAAVALDRLQADEIRSRLDAAALLRGPSIRRFVRADQRCLAANPTQDPFCTNSATRRD